MKKIINGKVYDTQKAECVGKWNNGLAGFDWCEEELYRKRTGEFFLFGGEIKELKSLVNLENELKVFERVVI